MIIWTILGLVLLVIFFSTVKLNRQWEESVILRLGKYVRTTKAGMFFKMPFLESAYKRDMRTNTLDIPSQEVITRDNISVSVDAVMWAKVRDSMKSVVNIRNYEYAVRQFSQTTLRNIIGKRDLDEVLEKRDEIAQNIKEIVDKEVEKWGVDIENIELQNIELPADMKRIMARQAEAEREKRGVIIAAEGEMEAAKKLSKASEELQKTKYGYALRQLQTISDVSQDQSNTIIFAPSEALNSPALATGVSAKVPKAKR
ncbi:MAG: SPFH domain-containing protein [Candidatus Aenigmarchaeota archaeon]|nr:SPFH domain-containing protein [Candidatus Aenigmarchaeota archaeon]